MDTLTQLDNPPEPPPATMSVSFPDGNGEILCRDTGRLIKLEDDQHPLLQPATVVLFEWTDYRVRYDGAEALRVGERVLEPLAGIFDLKFENQLGLTSIQPITADRPLPPPLHVEVISPKFPTVKQHIEFFSTLLDDLFTRAANLPFALSGVTARGVSEAPIPPSPLFTLHFLLQHQRDIAEAIRIIEARPHRRLSDHPELVPIGAASDIDADVLLDVVTSPERWVPAKHLRISERLRGHAPTHVWQRQPEESLDTPENRFVLAFFRSLLAATNQLLDQPWWKKVREERRAVIHDMQATLRRATEAPMFVEVGEMQRIPASSRVLMRREGYRQSFNLWRLFHAARQPFFGQLQHAIDLRTVDLLYEMWCFYALVEEIQVALGTPPVLELVMSDQNGLQWRSEARFGDHGRLVYNQSIKGYSVGLRPDFLWYRAGNPEVAFDAKFRLQHIKWGDDDNRTTVKNDDLYKMHTYRDALKLRAAVVIYPGSISRFYSIDLISHNVSMEHTLVDELSGIGAFNMNPVTPNGANS